MAEWRSAKTTTDPQLCSHCHLHQLSDIGLPEIDGYDFMRRLRELEGDGERIPAIAVTGYAGAIDESKALNAGYALHLSKPIELNELAKAIARVSRRV